MAYVVLQNYYLCFESDGNIVLENIADKDNCCSPAELNMGNDDIANGACSYCQDISISENCDEYYTFIKTNLKLFQVFDLCSSSTQHSIDRNKINFTTVNENISSHHLNSYKTIQLLI
jgi:hypothetical protein